MYIALRVLGVLLVLQGVGGIIDHLGGSLWFGLFVVNRSGLFGGIEIYANLVLAVLGAALTFAASTLATGSRK
jgi:hypothetical protein